MKVLQSVSYFSEKSLTATGEQNGLVRKKHTRYSSHELTRDQDISGDCFPLIGPTRLGE